VRTYYDFLFLTILMEISGKRHKITSTAEVDSDIVKIVDKELAVLRAALEKPICITAVALNTKSKHVRYQEVRSGSQ